MPSKQQNYIDEEKKAISGEAVRNGNSLPQAAHLLRQKKSMYKLLVLKQPQCIFPEKIQTVFF